MTEVSIERLTKTFGSARAVDSISIRIADGEFISLLGPSGCGKTTTLKMIAGFEEASEGAIRFDGKDVVNVPAEKRDIGMVFQNYALFPHMTVDQNLAFGLEMRKIAKPEMLSRIAKVLDMVQLGGYSDRYPNQLSGGQQQRVALARALAPQPKVLLLDEPLSALDKKLREQMQVELRRLQQAVGITFVLVTHDQYEALAMSDRIAVMFGGRIAQVASPKEIYQRPVNRQVADFLGGMNFVKAEIVEEDGASLVVDTLGFGRVKTDKPKAFVRNGGAATLGIRPERLRVL
ncbi:MAG: ABC transporter ATP-binding protein, partial [Mesorhizobium sp.]